jgi:hypothetical protein
MFRRIIDSAYIMFLVLSVIISLYSVFRMIQSVNEMSRTNLKNETRIN